MELWQEALTRTSKGPDLYQWSLKNGARCVMAPMPDATLTCLDFWCKAGSCSELEGEEGLAHFLEHMVFKGSCHLEAGEFDRKIEALGGSSNAATGFDDVHFYVLVPPQEATNALDLLLSLVLTPSLLPKAFSMEREVVLEEIAQYKDQPEEQAFQKLLGNCLKGHPYGRAILGIESSLKALNPEKMDAFHQRRYTGENCCLSIAGSIPSQLQEIISNSLLAEVDKNSTNNSYLKGIGLNFQTGREVIGIPRLESSRLLMAWQVPSASEQEMVVGADLATSLMAEGRRSRLVQQLREELQIVESIDMDVTVLEEGSLVVLEACCAEKHLEHVEKESHNLLRRALDFPPNSQELKRAHQLVKNGLCFNLEASCQIAGLAGNQALWGRSQPLLEPIKYINSWSANRLQHEIFPLLQPENSFTLIANPLQTNR